MFPHNLNFIILLQLTFLVSLGYLDRRIESKRIQAGQRTRCGCCCRCRLRIQWPLFSFSILPKCRLSVGFASLEPDMYIHPLKNNCLFSVLPFLYSVTIRKAELVCLNANKGLNNTENKKPKENSKAIQYDDHY